ncbi:MAG TPA: tetratricopeptide repeat protein [Minicystis sp.]|nr:tetratricopeptide repeat protein [Minicystis sp.]
MRPFLRSNSAILGASIAVAALGAIGFAPLFGGPGYESSLAAGIVLPPVVAVTTAIELSEDPVEPFDAFCRGVANGAVFAALALVVTLLHGLRTGFCDVLGGMAVFGLGPAPGALLAGAWGALAGEVARPRRARRWVRYVVAVVVALAAPALSVVLALSRFYTSPMIFAYDPFVGYFSDTLYDTVINYSGLLSYRAGTAATLFAGFVAALHLGHDDEGRLAFQDIGRPGLLVFGGAALAASAACVVEGYRMHHWSTASTIADELGAVLTGDRCDVVYPRSLAPDDARRFLGECEAHVTAGEAWLGTKGPPKITAYLFADAAQKALLMGAADTNIAKPWRHEVYVQVSGYPHPVLGHEIAHVLAGSFGRGPFRVAGSAGGLLPNPGLIEGVAVAAAPPEGELTAREWAKAMKDLGLLPPLARLYGLGFLGENAGVAYTVSGAFCGFVHDAFGADALRAWYGGKDLAAVTGVPWSEMERRWHEDLDKVTLPEAAKAHAKARFDRPAVFGRRCPHVVDACKGKGERLRVSGDEVGARAAFDRALALDPGDFGARLGVARSYYRGGRIDEAKAALQKLADDEKLPAVQRDRAREELADVLLATGDGERAVAIYKDVEQRAIDEDQLRTLDVKMASVKDALSRRAITAQLVGFPFVGTDRVLAAESLGAWSAASPTDGLPLYLLGRHYYTAGRFDQAKERLDKALGARIELARVQIEAERLRLVVACALGDVPTAERWYAAYAAHPTVSAARREAARRLVERCKQTAPKQEQPR